MIITVAYKPVVSKGGVALMSQNIRLTGCGTGEQEARKALTEGVLAWCRALQKHGTLNDAISRAGLCAEDDGQNNISVVLHREQTTERVG